MIENKRIINKNIFPKFEDESLFPIICRIISDIFFK